MTSCSRVHKSLSRRRERSETVKRDDAVEKELFSVLAITLTFIAYIPYIRSIQAGVTKPHVFSWVIWGLSTLIVFAAQLAGGGGVGAWPIGVSALITIYVAGLAYLKKADSSITTADWGFLTLAILALPTWIATDDPLWAVIILTLVDLFGFGPTFRKAYARPFEEQLLFFALMALRNFISIAALEAYSLTTILFPAATGAACLLFIMMVRYRRLRA